MGCAAPLPRIDATMNFTLVHKQLSKRHGAGRIHFTDPSQQRGVKRHARPGLIVKPIYPPIAGFARAQSEKSCWIARSFVLWGIARQPRALR